MKDLGIRSLALLMAASMALPLTATAGPMKRRTLTAREGDNTVYFHWNSAKKEVTEATSSRRLAAGQKVELLTSLSDRTGKIEMKAVLRNISDRTIYVVDGRLVHLVSVSGDVVRTLRSRALDTALRPGEKIVIHFSYLLKSGDYSARTDLTTD